MTKAQELSHLDILIEQLGPDSYLGPWLTEVKGEVERDIKSDFAPTVTLAQSKQVCATMIAKAQAESKLMIEKAQAEVKRQDERPGKLIESVASALRRSLHAIDDRYDTA